MADGAYGGMATFKQAGFQDRFQEKNKKVNRVIGLIKTKESLNCGFHQP